MREWLKTMRKRKGFTCKQMASRLQMSESFYNRVEAGERKKKLDIPTAQAIAQALEIPLETIVTMELSGR